MLRFANAYILWALVLVPVLIIIFLLVRNWKKRALASLGDKGIISRIMPEVSLSRPTLKFIFFYCRLYFTNHRHCRSAGRQPYR